MALNENELKFRSVSSFFDQFGTELRVPGFQRPYSWKPHNALQLCQDLAEQEEQKADEDYVLGTVILHSADENGRTVYNIVDGQQRLVTLNVLRQLLDSGGAQPAADTDSPLAAVTKELRRYVRNLNKADRFKNYLDDHCILLTVVTNSEDEAFQFFDSQNSRGKSLRPHDLLKAFHLREMRGHSVERQRAAVAGWEAIGEAKLDTLFTGVLARIVSWSRHNRSLDFTQDDIPMFKGLTAGTATPAAHYHRAAQLLLPGVTAWQSGTTRAQERGDVEGAKLTERDYQRIRYQLDAPIVAGEHFFEMVAFMQSEVQLFNRHYFGLDSAGKKVDFEAPLSAFAKDPRYRYCNALFLCAILYYSNKFSGQEMRPHAIALAKWAYAPRLRPDRSRVTWRSIDNHARGQADNGQVAPDKNLLAQMRDAFTARELTLEDIELITPKPESNYVALYNILDQGVGL